MASPLTLMKGKGGCPQCLKENSKGKEKMEFFECLIKVHEGSGGKIDLICDFDDYHGAREKALMHCNVCGYEWMGSPSAILNGATGCPHCATMKNAEKSRQPWSEVKVRIEEMHPDINMFCGNYVNQNSRILCQCKKCGKVWTPIAESLLAGTGCPECGKWEGGKKRRRKWEDVEKELHEEHPNIEFDGSNYTIVTEKIKCKCKICGHVWYSQPSRLLSGQGCPNCKKSKGEKRIEKFLKDYNINYDPQHDFDGLVGVGGNPLLFDFYLPDYKIVIEFQGEFHDNSNRTDRIQPKKKFKNLQIHDQRKRDYANEHEIKEIEIWYWDFDNIEDILIKELNLKENKDE